MGQIGADILPIEKKQQRRGAHSRRDNKINDIPDLSTHGVPHEPPRVKFKLQLLLLRQHFYFHNPNNSIKWAATRIDRNLQVRVGGSYLLRSKIEIERQTSYRISRKWGDTSVTLQVAKRDVKCQNLGDHPPTVILLAFGVQILKRFSQLILML